MGLEKAALSGAPVVRRNRRGSSADEKSPHLHHKRKSKDFRFVFSILASAPTGIYNMYIPYQGVVPYDDH